MHHLRTSTLIGSRRLSVACMALTLLTTGCPSKDDPSPSPPSQASPKAPSQGSNDPKTGPAATAKGASPASPSSKAKPHALAGAPALKPGEERWHGVIDLGARKIEVVVDLSPGISDWTATLGLPGTQQWGIPLKDVSYDDKRLAFTLHKPSNPDANEVYVLDREGPVAGGGTMTINGKSFPWSATKLSAKGTIKPANKRPQTPKPPFPYPSQPLTVVNPEGNVRRAGVLFLPKGADGAKVPVVIIESGSGPQDRDGTVAEHKPYLVIADHLARHGIGSFRADDRGVGGSTGDDISSDHAALAGDVLAMVAALKTHPRIDPTKIGVMGHSQGGIVAPLAATMSPDIAFVVMLAGIGVPGDQVMMDQKRLILTSHGMPEDKLAKSLKAQRAMLDGVLNDASEETLRAAVAASIAVDLPKGQLALLTPKRQQAIVDAGVKSLRAGFMKALVKAKPATYLSKVKVPTLAIWGARDLQVEPKSNAAGVKAAFEAAGHKAFEIHIIEDMSHNLQETKTGKVGELATIEETVRPVLLKKLSDWILATTGGHKGGKATRDSD